jgi:hypothetical protein
MLRALISLPLLLLIPGYFLIRVSRRGAAPSRHISRRAWLQGIVASMVISSWAALLLLESASFSLRNLCLVLAGFSLTLYLVFRPPMRGSREGGMSPARSWPLAVILCAFFLACALVGPSEYLFGGWDSGEYVNMGALIADRGRIVYHDAFFASVPEDARTLFTQEGRRYMGFNLTSIKDSTVSPKFMHLYPLWLALAIELAGLRAALSLNIFFSLISLALCYQVAFRLHGRGAALAAAALMGTNVLQLWFGRAQCAEPLAQLFFLGCIYFWVLWQREESLVCALLSAACAGMMFLTKIDTLTILLPLVAALVLFERRRGELLFLIVLLAAISHMAIHLSWWDRPYAYAVFANLPFDRGRKGIAPAAAGCAVIILALYVLKRARARGITLTAMPPVLRVWSGSAGLAFIAVVYFVRPAMSSSPEAANLPEFSRVIGEGVFWWAVAGSLWMWVKGPRSEEGSLWLSALVATALLSFSLAGERHLYPWSARRFLPVTIPAGVIMAGCFAAAVASALPRKLRLLPAAGLCALILSPMLRYPFLITARDYPGAVSFIRRIDDAAAGFDILVCEQVKLAVPLDFLCRRNVLLFKESEQTVEKCGRVENVIARWLAEGKRVAYLTGGAAIYGKRLAFRQVAVVPLETAVIPLKSHGMPPGAVEVDAGALVLEALPGGAVPSDNEYLVDIGYSCFSLEDGFYGPQRIGRRGGVGRWTAPRASLIIPWFGDGSPTTIVLSLSTGPRRSAPVPVEVLVQGKVVATLAARSAVDDYTVTLPAGIAPGEQRVRLELRAPAWNPAEAGLHDYPSPLGVFLDSVKILRNNHGSKYTTKNTKVTK